MTVLSNERNPAKGDALYRFTEGTREDRRLAPQEIRVQQAWARALGKGGILTAAETQRVLTALEEARHLIAAEHFDWRIQDEDVHMNLERFVVERCGELGKKMHLGRSRNDLIATSLRLFVSESSADVARAVRSLALTLTGQAEKTLDVIVPGMTHLQNGQPIRFGHVLAAHGWAFARDLARIRAASQRCLDSMPLGSAALSGTPLAVDLDEIARELGFSACSANSYDSVGDRDFLLEALSTYSIAAVHLSRLAEDFIIWASTPVALVKLPASWSTGSSIMPNKRNPDVPELIRARAAHLLSASANALSLMKGLPTSYASDLHELKGIHLRALDEITRCLEAFTSFSETFTVDRQAAGRLLRSGHILATEVADLLAARGVPFRDAYSQVAALVEQADSRGVQVHELVGPEAPEFMKSLTPESAVERRINLGGTSLESARSGIAALRAALG